MKRRLIESFIVILVTATILAAAVQTINTLPLNNSSFISTLQAFLRNENPNRFHYKHSGYIFEGGIGATSAGLTHTISATKGFPGGYYVYKAATSHTYTNNTRTYVFLDYDSARTITIPAASVTRSTHLVFAEMSPGSDEPATPSLSVPLMTVDTSGGAITTVSDLRPAGEIAFDCYDNMTQAITKIPTNGTLLLDSRIVPPDNATINSIAIERGGALSIDSGKAVTVNQVTRAPNTQWIYGSGRLIFAAGVSPIVGDWFGSDLYKAHNSATSGSVITYFSDQIVSAPIVMNKLHVSIEGGNGMAYRVTPDTGWTPGVYMIQVGEYVEYAYPFAHIENVFLDGRIGATGDRVASGIELRSAAMGMYAKNVRIDNAYDWAIYERQDNISSADYPIRPKFDNIQINNPGTGCLKIRNNYNNQASLPTVLDDFFCDGKSDTATYGILIDANNTTSSATAIDMHNVHITSIVGHGIETRGQVHMNWVGGSIENCGTTPGACREWDASMASLYTVSITGVATLGLDAHISQVQFQTMPYVDEYSKVVCSNCGPNYQINLLGTTQKWGSLTSYSHAGPPNFPYSYVLLAADPVPPWYTAEYYCYGQSAPYCKYNTGTVVTDGYGVRWQSDHGGNATDNSTGWRALDFPIKIPFDYEDFDGTNTINIWYPTEGFAIDRLDVWFAGWDCTPDNTTIHFGTDDDTSYFMDPVTPEGMLYNIASDQYVTPWVMASQRCPYSEILGYNVCPGATYPDLSANGLYNYINAYVTGGTCSAGNALVMIYGKFLGAIPGGSTP
jgi:hypothetical protein